MRIQDLLEKWRISDLKLPPSLMESSWQPTEADKSAAWELLVELLTRITTQPLPDNVGEEQAALDSVYGVFSIMRKTLKRRGRASAGIAAIAISVLNRVLRPFTARWHRSSGQSAFELKADRKAFRKELAALQVQLIQFVGLLAEVAEVAQLQDLADGGT